MADEIIIETSTPEIIEVGLPGPQGPKGDTGDVGPANSLTIGTVTTGAAGSNASATITGTAPNQTLDLDIPRGDTGATGPQGAAATVAVGTVSTGAPGSPANVTNAGTSGAAILNFDIPQGATGATGPANSLAIGTVSTGAEGSNADATITGTAPNQTLNLTIPVGATGATGPIGPQGPAGTATTDASELTTGTLADARLSTNVPLLDAANTYTQNQTLDGTNNVAPNQTAASGSSIMTRDLGDARYWQLYSRLQNNQTINNQATLQNIVSVSLAVGTYELKLYWALDGTANTGTRHGFSFDGTGVFRLYRTRSSNMAYIREAGTINLGIAETNTTAWVFGIVDVSAAGTLWLQAAQNTAHADNLTVSTYTRIHAQRIS